jgi:hypothetical protein
MTQCFIIRNVLTRDEQLVVSVLASVGISAEKIPESSQRTPDLLASDSERRYLIEVKSRSDDETLKTELREKRMAYRTWPVGPTKAVVGIFQYAISQIAAKASDELRLIWVCVESRRGGEQTLADQVRHTLYGISRIAGSGRAATAPECYFFHESIFYRYQQLDGAVITFQNRLVLCLNTYSPRVSELRKSKLAHAFPRNILDPLQLEREGRCLIADCAADRKDSAAMLEHLRAKYLLDHAVNFNFDEHAAFAIVDPDSPENTLDLEPEVDPWLDDESPCRRPVN